MGDYYRLTGTTDPASRIDRVEVESPSEDHPGGLFLELNGEPQPLSQDQVDKLSSYVTLERVDDYDPSGADAQWVDQPGIERPSTSTDSPPQLGTTPDLDAMNGDALKDELDRVRAQDPDALPDLHKNSKVEDLRAGLANYHAKKGV